MARLARCQWSFSLYRSVGRAAGLLIEPEVGPWVGEQGSRAGVESSESRGQVFHCCINGSQVITIQRWLGRSDWSFRGALYHVTARGDRREAIYEDDADRQQFPVLLGEVVADFNWRCHAYCLIDHYHLAVETSDGNLSKGMHGLNGVFTQASKSAWRTGHLLQGRYKTVLVDDSHHLELTRYVVLNSVCAGMVTAPGDWPWSSYRATMGADATHTRVAASVGFMVTFVADIYPSGRRIEYERDILGRITAVRAEVAGTMQPLLSDIRYRADGQLTSARFGNGLNQVRQYDRQGRLLEQRLFDDSGTILDLRQYRYDPAGNLTARAGTPGDQQYDYDALDRLIGQRIAANDQDWQYAYDANHNRQQRSDGVLNEVYGYRPNSNRLTEIDRLLASTPDPAAPRSKRFEYNQAGRLAEYREDGQSIARYTYNALGQRTRKELEHETRLYHYDNGIQLLSETDAEGKPIKDYVWLDNEPLAQIEATGTVVYLHTDHLLTPRLGSSDARQIVWRWEGEAFGDAEAQGPMEVNLRFPGQYFDAETGQHYNYSRDYEPGTGRYVESDPIGLKGGISTYAYVTGHPLAFADPLGLCQCRAANIPGIGYQGTKQATTDNGWLLGIWGSIRKVSCQYECRPNQNAAPQTIRASHEEKYFSTSKWDDGREGVCLGTTFYDPLFMHNLNRLVYSPAAAEWFDPSESDDRGFKSTELENWARQNCKDCQQ